jgi:hypothetical protein
MFDVGGWVCAAAFASQESTLRANVAAAQERAAAAAAAAGPGGSPTRGVRGGGGEHWGRGGAGRSPERVQRLTLEPRRGGAGVVGAGDWAALAAAGGVGVGGGLLGSGVPGAATQPRRRGTYSEGTQSPEAAQERARRRCAPPPPLHHVL